VTSSDSISPHIDEWAKIVFANVVQLSFVCSSGTTLPRFVRQSTEWQVNVAAQSLMDWNSTRHPGNVTEDGVATLDDLIHYWGKTGQICDFNIPQIV